MSSGEVPAWRPRWGGALPIAMLTAAVLILGGAPAAAAADASAGAAQVSATRIALTETGMAPRSVASQAKPVRIIAYRNCAALQKVYRHGVGKKGAVDKSSGRVKTSRVKNFYVNTNLYAKNKKLDRDKDGVACEKK